MGFVMSEKAFYVRLIHFLICFICTFWLN